MRYKFRCDETNYMDEETKKKYNMMNNLKQQLEWVKRQLEYISYQEKYEPSLELKVGEIYEFDWGVNVNCEFSNRHYGVVLADSHANNPLVIVCPLKSNKYGANPCSDINLGHIEGLVTERETLAIVNQIRALDKMRLYVRPIINDTKDENAKIKLNDVQIKKLIDGLKHVFIKI
ncbi:MAG: type II toxin-antitoxin system PemK/MazF family toxin [Erysipelotrichaceae bacterium]|nr:type II toxin-antitoxin system PemK/MazF family toxin [Erysipelotrichaceae bacterium]